MILQADLTQLPCLTFEDIWPFLAGGFVLMLICSYIRGWIMAYKADRRRQRRMIMEETDRLLSTPPPVNYSKK